MLISKEEIKERIALHERWKIGMEGGDRLVIRGLTLRELDLSQMNLSEAKFVSCNFEGVRFDKSKLDMCEFRNCVFVNCSIVGASASGMLIRESVLVAVDGRHTDFSRSNFISCEISRVDFSYSILNYADFFRSEVGGMTLRGVSTQGIEHIDIFSCNGLGEDMGTLVFLCKNDKLWFSNFEGPLSDFKKRLRSNFFGLNTEDKEMLLLLASSLDKRRSTGRDTMVG